MGNGCFPRQDGKLVSTKVLFGNEMALIYLWQIVTGPC